MSTHHRTIAGIAAAAALALAATTAAAAGGLRVETREASTTSFEQDWFWMEAGPGYQRVDLGTPGGGLSKLTAGLVPEIMGGQTIDLGVGTKLSVLTVGPRVRISSLDADGPSPAGLDLWSMDAEVGLRIPLGRVEPHFTVAAGYTGLGGVGQMITQLDETFDIHGANVRIGAGVDVLLIPYLSVGADMSVEAIALSRSGAPIEKLEDARDAGSLTDAQVKILEEDKTSTGVAFTVIANLGFHF